VKIRLAFIAENVAVIAMVGVARLLTQLRTGPGHAGSLQPEKNELDPLVVSACKVTYCVVNDAEQVPGQAIPAGDDVTVPVPTVEIVTCTVPVVVSVSVTEPPGDADTVT
jgi:hypothetical protein